MRKKLIPIAEEVAHSLDKTLTEYINTKSKELDAHPSDVAIAILVGTCSFVKGWFTKMADAEKNNDIGRIGWSGCHELAKSIDQVDMIIGDRSQE